jgi:hypothetical protein
MLPGLTARDLEELLLSVGKTPNELRPLSPVEVGERCRAAQAAGATRSQIAEAVALKDTGMIGKFLRLAELHHDVQHLVSWGRTGTDAIGFSVADQVARIPRNEQPKVVEAILRFAPTRDEMASVVQLHDRSGQDLESCLERVVRRRSSVTVRTVILGAISDLALQDQLSHLTQKQRDTALAAVVVELQCATEIAVAKLGVDRFAIVGGRTLATITSDANFEQRIGSLLTGHLCK